jgi:hypothetical protein
MLAVERSVQSQWVKIRGIFVGGPSLMMDLKIRKIAEESCLTIMIVYK